MLLLVRMFTGVGRKNPIPKSRCIREQLDLMEKS